MLSRHFSGAALTRFFGRPARPAAPVQDPVLSRARQNMADALSLPGRSSLPDPGERWRQQLERFREAIPQFSSAAEAIHYGQGALHSSNIGMSRAGEALTAHLEAIDAFCRHRYPEFAQYIDTFTETGLSLPSTLTKLNDRLASETTYHDMRVVMSVARTLRPTTVAEIAGGYGSLARSWFTNKLTRPDVYIIVDFEENLFFSEVFLRKSLPYSNIVYFYGNDTSFIFECNTVVLCPFQFFDRLQSLEIDIFVDAGSLRELSDDYVELCTNLIERSSNKYFFSLNRFNEPLDTTAKDSGLSLPGLGNSWKPIVLEYLESGKERGGMVERFLKRAAGAYRQAEPDEALVLACGAPRNGDELLSLFDAVRRSTDRELLAAAARLAVVGMPYPPREALWLMRRAAPRSGGDFELLQTLENMLGGGNGTVYHAHDISGAMFEDRLLIEDIEYALEVRSCGAVERWEEVDGELVLSGWGGDVPNGSPLSGVVVFVDGRPVSRTIPFGNREDIEAGYGANIRPAQFSIRLGSIKPGETAAIRQVSVYGLTRDFKAFLLPATGFVQPDYAVIS